LWDGGKGPGGVYREFSVFKTAYRGTSNKIPEMGCLITITDATVTCYDA